ncbi:hypothetical protein AB0B78_38515 [Streptomyces sp. NPDC040724]|uniref:hypothetical protein n=1 Tax=Streptomyces sp. NPDC040724 TaxID=3155612 RepID=UPI003405A12A
MYVEKLPKTWSVICVGLYLAGVIAMGVDSIPQDTGAWLAVSAIFLLLLLPCLGVPISKRIYNRIRIDPSKGTLRVGREQFALATIDPGSVHAALQQAAPGMAARYATSAGSIDAPIPGLRASDFGAPRLVGGGWGVPMGMDSVVIATRQGEQLSIATHDRTAFLTALAQATGAAY